MDRQTIAQNLSAAATRHCEQIDWTDVDDVDAELTELAGGALDAIEEENP